MCNNLSDNRPDHTYHNFRQILKQVEDEKFSGSCEERSRSLKALRISIVVQSISYQTITELVSPDIERT